MDTSTFQQTIQQTLQQTTSNFGQILKESGLKLVATIYIVILGILIIKNLIKIIRVALISSSMDNALINFFLTIIRFLLYFVLILFSLRSLGVPLTGFVSAVSAATLAIMLALQNIMSGIAHGIMLATTHPFGVNDFVDIGGISGTVQEITLMHTVLDTVDGKHVFLPNSTVFTSNITNISFNSSRRIELIIGVDYGCNQVKAKALLLKVLSSHPLVLDEPEPEDHYNATAADGITHSLRAWVDKENYWPVYWELSEQIYEELVKHGFSIPFRQVTISYRDDDKKSSKPAKELKETKIKETETND